MIGEQEKASETFRWTRVLYLHEQTHKQTHEKRPSPQQSSKRLSLLQGPQKLHDHQRTLRRRARKPFPPPPPPPPSFCCRPLLFHGPPLSSLLPHLVQSGLDLDQSYLFSHCDTVFFYCSLACSWFLVCFFSHFLVRLCRMDDTVAIYVQPCFPLPLSFQKPVEFVLFYRFGLLL